MGKTINIDLETNTAKFITDTNNAGKSLEGLGKHAEGAGSMMSKFTEGLGIGTGIEAAHTGLELVSKAFEAVVDVGKEAVSMVSEWTEHAIESAEKTSHFAEAFGYSTELVGALGKEAGFLGLTAEDVQGAMSKLQKNIGEAGEKGGESAEAFKRLGVNLDTLSKQSSDQQFLTIADALSKVSDQSERNYLTTELLGKSAGQLGGMFKDGAKGLEEMVAQHLKWGDAINATDTAKLTQAGEEMKKVSSVLEGMENQLAIGIAPAIDVISEKFLAVGGDVSKIKAAVEVLLEEIIKDGAIATDAVLELGASMLRLDSAVMKAQATMDKFTMRGDAAKELMDEAATVDSLANGMDKLGSAAIGTGAQIVAAMEMSSKSVEKVTSKSHSGFGSGGGAMAGMVKEAQDADKEIAKLQEKLDDFGATADQKVLLKLFDDGDYTKFIQAASIVQQLEQRESAQKSGAAIDKMQQRIAELGMSAADKAAIELEKQGVDEKTAKSLSHILDLKEKHLSIEEKLAKIKKEASEAGMSKSEKELKEFEDSGASKSEVRAYKDAQKTIDQWKPDNQQDDKANKNRSAALIERHFDFRMPGQSKHDPQKQVAELAKKQDQRADQWHTWFNKIYDYVNKADSDQTVVFDDPG